MDIKLANKKAFADFIINQSKKLGGFEINPNAIYDVQIKRSYISVSI